MEDTERTEAAELSMEDVIAGLSLNDQAQGGGQDTPSAREEPADEADEPVQEGQGGAQTEARPEARKEDSPQASDAQVEAVRTLLADGWTREELLAFSQDETAQKDMAGGRSMRQAALSYLRRQSAAERGGDGAKKRGAPIARNTSSGGTPETDPIRSMTDAQYDRFMADVRRRAMRGEKIRI